MSNSAALFACSKCLSKHRFEDLTFEQHLCKECRGNHPSVTCTFCRSEFQQIDSQSTITICKKCKMFMRTYGTPSSCIYCYTFAAFIGSKCQRCTELEWKYGPPIICEKCKQRCAFDCNNKSKNSMNYNSSKDLFSILNRLLYKEEDKTENCSFKLEGKLCWLCTQSYKKTMANPHQSEVNSQVLCRELVQRVPIQAEAASIPPLCSWEKNSNTGGEAIKRPRIMSHHDLGLNCMDEVSTIIQLKEKVASLESQSRIKDANTLSKNKLIAELKAKQFQTEKEFEAKINKLTKEYDKTIERIKSTNLSLTRANGSLRKKLRMLEKETLNSEKKKHNVNRD